MDLLPIRSETMNPTRVNVLQYFFCLLVCVWHFLQKFSEKINQRLILEEYAEEQAVEKGGGVEFDVAAVVADTLNDLNVHVVRPLPFLFPLQPVRLLEPEKYFVVEVHLFFESLEF